MNLVIFLLVISLVGAEDLPQTCLVQDFRVNTLNSTLGVKLMPTLEVNLVEQNCTNCSWLAQRYPDLLPSSFDSNQTMFDWLMQYPVSSNSSCWVKGNLSDTYVLYLERLPGPTPDNDDDDSGDDTVKIVLWSLTIFFQSCTIMVGCCTIMIWCCVIMCWGCTWVIIICNAFIVASTSLGITGAANRRVSNC